MDRAREAGVKKVVCCGTKEDDWEAVRRLKHDYPDMVIASFGLHPWYIKERSPDWLRRLEGFSAGSALGVGEFGLDFAIEGFDTIEQKDLFTQQLSLAKRLKRPVSIHCRKAWDTLIDILGNFGQLSAAGLVHSYSGGPGFIPV
jgi:TatD DNase family protein